METKENELVVRLVFSGDDLRQINEAGLNTDQLVVLFISALAAVIEEHNETGKIAFFEKNIPAECWPEIIEVH